MIDANKLDAFSLETLQKLGKQITEAIGRKQRQVLRPGIEATFLHPQQGRRIRIMIQKVNPKTIGGYEIDDDGIHLRRKTWRVAPNLLEVVPPKVIVPIKLGVGKDAPATVASW